jgi:hypothetical protein
MLGARPCLRGCGRTRARVLPRIEAAGVSYIRSGISDSEDVFVVGAKYEFSQNGRSTRKTP